MTTEQDRTLREFDYAHDDIKNLIQALTDDLEAANEECQRLREETESLAGDLLDAQDAEAILGEENGRLEAEIERLKEQEREVEG